MSKSKAAPIATPEVPVEEKKPTEELKPAFTFILTSDKHEAFGQVPSYFHDSVLRACADRLDDSPSVKVEIAYRDMNRGEAIRRAKAEKEAFVVWMQLRTDSGRIGQEDLSELYLDFWVFAPTTAKVKLSGRSYQGNYGVGGVITTPRNRASLPHAELMLKQAAREAAEKILAAVRDQPAGAPVPGIAVGKRQLSALPKESKSRRRQSVDCSIPTYIRADSKKESHPRKWVDISDQTCFVFASKVHI